MTDQDRLAPTELRAALLDGELYTVGDAYLSIADTDDTARRAREFGAAVGHPSLVAERTSAAWIWGGLSRAPVRHTACMRPGTRLRGPFPGIVVREPALTGAELVRIDGVWVTTPLRTAVDLLRDGRAGLDGVRGLIHARGIDAAAIRSALETAGPRPQWRRALRVLRTIERPDQEARTG
ncbi:hypothetical protein [Curtobacterium sp. RRHDQ10]|uniref:hypothetical protein n=1 Tax=Curtobacterium phyllosphaerae TaxID=3413379 RepID=UPI003BF1498C